jgi:periplasmic protein TonB
MTNKEILQSDMLDILFEHRNKSYGAYALRRTYDRRLLTALIAGMSVIFLFIFINAINGNDAIVNKPGDNDNSVVVTQVEMPKDEPEKPKEQEKPKEAPKPVKPVATIKHLIPVIKPDKEVPNTEVPENADIKDKQVGEENIEGEKPGNIVPPEVPKNDPGNGKTNEEEQPEMVFIPNERQPEFPGGMEALSRYLSRNLNTPDELNSGEKKTVRVRFWVAKDGGISNVEIEQSAGDSFDKEVIRVCKKMPRWKAAIQNGVTVPVSYLLPVTFIGSEQ